MRTEKKKKKSTKVTDPRQFSPTETEQAASERTNFLPPLFLSNNRMRINASKIGKGQGRKGVARRVAAGHHHRGVSRRGEHATRLAATRRRHLFLGGRGSDHLLPPQQLCERGRERETRGARRTEMRVTDLNIGRERDGRRGERRGPARTDRGFN